MVNSEHCEVLQKEAGTFKKVVRSGSFGFRIFKPLPATFLSKVLAMQTSVNLSF